MARIANMASRSWRELRYAVSTHHVALGRDSSRIMRVISSSFRVDPMTHMVQPLGTTELQKGTKGTTGSGAGACPSAKQ